MQSFARLMSAAPAASSSGLPRSTPAGNIGNFADGHGALDVAQREKAFGRGFFQRYLNNFPKQYQVAAGVATLTAAGVLLFATVSPAKNAGAPNSKVRTPAWEKATEEYLKTQRVSPSHQRSG